MGNVESSDDVNVTSDVDANQYKNGDIMEIMFPLYIYEKLKDDKLHCIVEAKCVYSDTTKQLHYIQNENDIDGLQYDLFFKLCTIYCNYHIHNRINKTTIVPDTTIHQTPILLFENDNEVVTYQSQITFLTGTPAAKIQMVVSQSCVINENIKESAIASAEYLITTNKDNVHSVIGTIMINEHDLVSMVINEDQTQYKRMEQKSGKRIVCDKQPNHSVRPDAKES
jgi:hypothetical protein